MRLNRVLLLIALNGCLFISLFIQVGSNTAIAGLSNLLLTSDDLYDIIDDGMGVDSLLPIPSNYGDIQGPISYCDGYILVGRGAGQRLFVSIVPHIGFMCGDGSHSLTNPTFVYLRIQFQNSSLIGFENTLKHFNWPYTEAGRYSRYGYDGEITDWLEVDAEHLHPPERDMWRWHPIGRSYAPDWWWERLAFNSGGNSTLAEYWQQNPVYDILEVTGHDEVVLQTTATEGTDSFVLSYNITQHPASIRILPLMDHKAYGCKEYIYVGPRGRAYEFEENIPLTRNPQKDEENPPVTPVEGKPPLLPSPVQLGQVGSLPSFSAVVSVSGAITAVGVTNGALIIILSLKSRPQVVGKEQRRRSKKELHSHKKMLLMSRAHQVSKDPSYILKRIGN